jgi:hypothetical protein
VCLFTVLPHFFNHPYSSYLTLPVYPSSSFLGSLGSLAELVKKKRDPSLQPLWEAVPAEHTMRSKLYGTEVGSLCQENTTTWYVLI